MAEDKTAAMPFTARKDVPEGFVDQLLDFQTDWIEDTCGCIVMIRGRRQWGPGKKITIHGPTGSSVDEAWGLVLLCLWQIGSPPPTTLPSAADWGIKEEPADTADTQPVAMAMEPMFVKFEQPIAHDVGSSDESDDEIQKRRQEMKREIDDLKLNKKKAKVLKEVDATIEELTKKKEKIIKSMVPDAHGIANIMRFHN